MEREASLNKVSPAVHNPFLFTFSSRCNAVKEIPALSPDQLYIMNTVKCELIISRSLRQTTAQQDNATEARHLQNSIIMIARVAGTLYTRRLTSNPPSRKRRSARQNKSAQVYIYTESVAPRRGGDVREGHDR